MDIGRMMRSVLGDMSSSETRVLELKPGQVVRGVVLNLLADNEAVVNINGTAVRARIETPLGVGQAAMLQVQPDSGSGVVLLKPLSASSMDIAPESLADVLRNIDLKDTPTNRSIVRMLHDEGIPLSKGTVAAVEAVLKQVAPSGNPEPWIRAAATAINRGLPLGADTVRGLHAAMAGPPLPSMLQALENSAREAASGPGTQPTVKQAAERLLGLLQRADTLLQQALLPRAAAAESVARPAMGGTVGAAVSNAPQPAAGVGPASAAQTARPAAGAATPSPPAERTAQPSAPQAAAAQPAAQRTASGGSASEPQVPPPASQAASRGAAESAPPEARPTQTPPAQPARSEERPPLLAFFKLLGLDAEREWLRASAVTANARDVSAAALPGVRAAVGAAEEKPAPNPLPERLLRAAGELPPPGTLPDRAQAAERSSAPLDTLKSALAVLAASDETPPALKEAAQSTLGHLAGQQLLMSGDRAAPFAHVTMFIPLRSKEGDEGNASVHIHTRRGKKGELDAENCRLWFQLDLSALGETWIDVQITNRVVGLQLWNDHPAAGELLSANKAAMESALKEMGYALLTFRHSPKPERSSADTVGTGGARADQLSATYAPKAYKGVDIRV